MGSQVVKFLTNKCLAHVNGNELKVLLVMAQTCYDEPTERRGEVRPERRFYAGWEYVAQKAFDVNTKTASTGACKSAQKRVERAIAGLKEKGFIVPLVSKPGFGRRQEFHLRLDPSDRPHVLLGQDESTDPTERGDNSPNEALGLDPTLDWDSSPDVLLGPMNKPQEQPLTSNSMHASTQPSIHHTLGADTGEACDAPTDMDDEEPPKPARSAAGLPDYFERLWPDGWMEFNELIGRTQPKVPPPGHERAKFAAGVAIEQLPRGVHFARADDEQMLQALYDAYTAEEQTLQTIEERTSA